ncbi:MAG: carbon-nitrogen hydrolase [Nitrospinaceae bacterium]|jgi:predicted amidohydrolase|nr:carbon-nitrogen hydrolase [Nitrospinaceae bacterium]MBT3433795.1 carbon-nitrogen hydrolase [Nitrospinaceae bacterium]MBT3823340.1 carbon-nitrogen hydrolase [Nitrospinaceae bacterium]MBT4092944.1 carbon-nitrogen hydrolase [Nitrospinaceae bacterium]MBT4429300.1 carbon-nitrogen hydrolase [Nitrospinaceae bacterium]
MKFNVGLAQVGPTLGNLEANQKIINAEVKKAIKRGVDLLVFPELSVTGYFLKDIVPEVALQKNSPLFKEIAAMSKDISIVVGFVEESSRHGFYNVAGYFEDGKLLHMHRKLYLPTYGLFDEARYVGAGKQVRAFDTRFGRAAMLICEDVWHPSLAYIASQDGADFLIVPSSSPARGVKKQNGGKSSLAIERVWNSLNRSHAAAFNQFVFFCNRVGYEDGISFWGGSEIISPTGELLVAAPRWKPKLLTAEINTADIRRARIATPTLRDEDLDLTIKELRRIQAAR